MSDNIGKSPEQLNEHMRPIVTVSRKNFRTRRDSDAHVNEGYVSSDRVSGLRNLFERHDRTKKAVEKQLPDGQTNDVAKPVLDDQMKEKKQGRWEPATSALRDEGVMDMLRRQEREQAAMLLVEQVARKLTTCEHTSESKKFMEAKMQSFMDSMLSSLQSKDEDIHNLQATQRRLRHTLYNLEERIEKLAERNELLERKTRDIGFQVAQTMKVSDTADTKEPKFTLKMPMKDVTEVGPEGCRIKRRRLEKPEHVHSDPQLPTMPTEKGSSSLTTSVVRYSNWASPNSKPSDRLDL